jgi:hypothetical protein
MRASVALLLLAACACSSGHGQPAGPGSGSASGSGSAVVTPAAEAKVTDAASATAAKGSKAAVTGMAGNAMLGAAIVLSDRTPVYCQPLERWPDDVDRKTVTAHGKLEQTNEFAASGDGAGTPGSVWVLRDCTYDPPSP